MSIPYKDKNKYPHAMGSPLEGLFNHSMQYTSVMQKSYYEHEGK
jgi:hypothetical protein